MKNLKTEMSLYELGQEYERYGELQQTFIDNCKKDIERAKASGDRDAVIKLERNLCKLREIKREIMQTAAILKMYYK